VRDLVEMGVFTEYKVYKSLFSLIKKNIIREKHKTPSDAIKEEHLLAELKITSGKKVNQLFIILLIFLLAIFIFSFLKPLRPLKSSKVLLNTGFYEKVFTGTGGRNTANQEKE
ncbi:MAG: hypothetical protein MUF15_25710, partial [Acidobacteria bacterium]|nr:hypothetical protein [Acidobacteriota bacterium]